MKFRNYFLMFALLFTSGILLTSCEDNDDDDGLTGEKITYQLSQRNNTGISGDITFEELNNGDIRATISLDNTPDGGVHPAHIHANSALQTGGILVPLTDVDGTTGISVTTFSTTSNGTELSFDDLLDLDAYVNVHLSASELNVIVAQTDIGGNALSGEEKEYTLNEVAVAGISGKIVMKKRNNGFTIAEIELSNTPDGGMHPAHIHANSASEGGPIAISLGMLDGSTGTLTADIRALDNGDAISYDELMDYNGYVNVHLSMDELATIVAQGNIGSNAN